MAWPNILGLGRNGKQKIQKDDERKRIGTEIGTTGLKIFGGDITEEFLPELSGRRKTDVYIEMETNDSTTGSMLFAIEKLIRQVEWMDVAANDSPQAQLARDLLESFRNDMSQTWDDTISEMLSFLVHGWSYHEMVLKIRGGPDQEDPKFRSKHSDGFIGWRKLPIRAQETLNDWVIDEDGGIRGMWQQAPPRFNRVFIPIEKSLLFRTSTHKNNPEGRSILRTSYRSWFFKKRIQTLEAIGVERDTAGIPIALVPSEITTRDAPSEAKQQLKRFEEIVQNLRRDEQEGITSFSDRDEKGHLRYEIMLLKSAGTRQFDTSKIISRYELDQLQTVLADFIKIGHEKTGSFALSSNKTALFIAAIGSYLNSITAVFNNFAIPRTMKLNGIRPENYPILEHGDIESTDLGELGELISKVTGAGMPLFPDKKVENYVRSQAGLPELPENNEMEVEPTGEFDDNTEEGSKVEPGKDLDVDSDATSLETIGFVSGAKVNAMLAIAKAVSSGDVSRSSGVQILVTTFGVSPEEAEKVLG